MHSNEDTCVQHAATRNSAISCDKVAGNNAACALLNRSFNFFTLSGQRIVH